MIRETTIAAAPTWSNPAIADRPGSTGPTVARLSPRDGDLQATARPADGPSVHGQDLANLARKAAHHMFNDRNVAISTFHDDDTGRTVIRVADRTSGKVIAQSPSEELLRFYAAWPEAHAPLVDLDI